MYKMNRMYLLLVLIMAWSVYLSPIVQGNDNSPETIIYVNSVTAREYDQNSFRNLNDAKYGVKYQGETMFASDTPNLYALLKREFYKKDGKDHAKSYITVVWGNSAEKLYIEGPVSYIRWRPTHTGFIYSLFHLYSGGDFGTSEIHYVDVTYSDGNIKLKDTVISPEHIATGLGWSSDGKYYAYAAASSLRIRDFETGTIWATKEIILSTSTGEIKIKEQRPYDFGGFIWIEGDQKILFSWKGHPFNDTASGYAEISTDQFRLF